MLSAIIAALAPNRKSRKSPLENEVKARGLVGREPGTLVSEFNCLLCSVALINADCRLKSAAGRASPAIRAARWKNTVSSDAYERPFAPARFLRRFTALWAAVQFAGSTPRVASRICESPPGRHIMKTGISCADYCCWWLDWRPWAASQLGLRLPMREWGHSIISHRAR